MEELIFINDCISFDTKSGIFQLSVEAQNILYRQKEVICSYSGCTDWGHFFFCELLNLYSGGSIYNYALGTVNHADEIAEAYKHGHQQEVIDWINRKKDEIWFCKAAAMLAYIINDVPKQ